MLFLLLLGIASMSSAKLTRFFQRFQKSGCAMPMRKCNDPTEGNCCRVPLSGMFPMRAAGAQFYSPDDYYVGIPYQRGNGIYCGTPIPDAAQLGGFICYQNSLLGSALYISCRGKSQELSLEQNLTDLSTRDTITGLESKYCPSAAKRQSQLN
jgi:hypothetical protein